MRISANMFFKKVTRYSVPVLAIILVFLCGVLFRDYRNIRRISDPPRYAPWRSADIDTIEAWMTFDYINHAFVLPPACLESALAVTDVRYPRITIARFAKNTNTAPAVILSRVRDAVRVCVAGS